MTAELEAQLTRGPLPAWGKRAKRAQAVHRFILRFAAAQARLRIPHGGLRPSEIEALKAAVVEYEGEWGSISQRDHEAVMHYLEHGIDSEPLHP
jgi:hypothetical protein